MKSKKILFDKYAGNPEQAFVLVFDLEGFTKFFSQPDVHFYVAKFLNKVFGAMDILINGGDAYWITKKEGDTQERYEDLKIIDKFREPVHVKFLSDGALYIWTYKEDEEKSFQSSLLTFINMLYNFRNDFKEFLKTCSDEVPVIDLPRMIRFGMASGSVYKLTYPNSRETEYIGYCINLASI